MKIEFLYFEGSPTVLPASFASLVILKLSQVFLLTFEYCLLFLSINSGLVHCGSTFVLKEII